MHIYWGFSKQPGSYGKTAAQTGAKTQVFSPKDEICFGGPFEQESDGADDNGREHQDSDPD